MDAPSPAVRLLASVRDAEEARLALAAGADLIDAKDPEAGALGALDPRAVRAIVAAVGGRALTSAVAGEPADADEMERALRLVAACGPDLVKVALPPGLDAGAVRRAVAGRPVIAVLFAEDGPGADALPAIARMGFSGAMIDTRGKTGARLTDLMPPQALARFVDACREHGLMSGLAGSLGVEHIPALAGLGPTYLGFRGGLCAGGDRRAGLDPDRVARAARGLAGRRDPQPLAQTA